MRGDVDPASVTFALPPPEARAEPHGDVFDVQPEQSATPVGAAPERSGDTDEARSGQGTEPHAVDDMLNAWKQLSDQPPEPEAATPRPTLEQVLAERRQETEARNNAEALRQRRDGLLRDWRQARLTRCWRAGSRRGSLSTWRTFHEHEGLAAALYIP